MVKTTIYLPEDLKKLLEARAASEGQSEAEIIRESLRETLRRQPPRPRLPLTKTGLGDPTACLRVDELLNGFGRS